jgi:hypothetical protein
VKDRPVTAAAPRGAKSWLRPPNKPPFSSATPQSPGSAADSCTPWAFPPFSACRP